MGGGDEMVRAGDQWKRLFSAMRARRMAAALLWRHCRDLLGRVVRRGDERPETSVGVEWLDLDAERDIDLKLHKGVVEVGQFGDGRIGRRWPEVHRLIGVDDEFQKGRFVLEILAEESDILAEESDSKARAAAGI